MRTTSSVRSMLRFLSFILFIAMSTAATSLMHHQRLSDFPLLGMVGTSCPGALATSHFNYTYNPAWFEVSQNDTIMGCLLVRVQNTETNKVTTPGPSKIAATCLHDSTDGASLFTDISTSSIVFEPQTSEEVLGTEDPRVAQINGTYFMFYTAVSLASDGRWIARLSLATSPDPLRKNSWKRYGALFPDIDNFQFTKSGALLVSPNRSLFPSYLIFGDCSLYQGLQVAVASADHTRYRVMEDFLLLEKRPGMFDSSLVESGPPPLLMKDGNYLFVYNGAQPLQGAPNGLFYSVGWAVLSGTNPLNVLQRAAKPLIMPALHWETRGLTPYVVFVEALRYAPQSIASSYPASATVFVAYYGAADSCIGGVVVVAERGQYGYALHVQS